MAFLLSRGGRNVPTEVQRWQYFLRKQDIPEVGQIDADFGINTEKGTVLFQTKFGIPKSGKLDSKTLDVARTLGYSVLPNNHYSKISSEAWPPPPADLTSPGNATRNRLFTCFNFIQLPRLQRPDDEAIVIKGTCDGAHRDWVAANIVTIDIPQLKFARGYSGRFGCHKKAAPLFAALFAKWETDDLLHLILSYEGCFVPRYIRDAAPPGRFGHRVKKSTQVRSLSNHSFGSAFDINFADNMRRRVPARAGARGCVRELVAAANATGVFWGGHFSTKDGMHFEISKIAN